ncbi:hypothetical protein DV26_42765 [Amycolatopsis mediterranei]|nr:hypothetical protein DV26_42765 [Amycolatopsis mediterranei]
MSSRARTGSPPRTQETAGKFAPAAGVSTSAASARWCAASRAATSRQRSRLSEPSSAAEVSPRNVVRSRSRASASRAERASVSSTSHQVTASPCGTGCAAKARSPTSPRTTSSGPRSWAAASQSATAPAAGQPEPALGTAGGRPR